MRPQNQIFFKTVWGACQATNQRPAVTQAPQGTPWGMYSYLSKIIVENYLQFNCKSLPRGTWCAGAKLRRIKAMRANKLQFTGEAKPPRKHIHQLAYIQISKRFEKSYFGRHDFSANILARVLVRKTPNSQMSRGLKPMDKISRELNSGKINT